MRHDPRRLRHRIVSQHAAGGGLLDDVEHAGRISAAPLRRQEARRRLREEDRAARRHDDRVGVADRIGRRHAIGQQDDAAIFTDRQKAFHGISGDHATLRIEVEAKNPAAGVGEHFLFAAILIHADKIAAGYREIQPAVLADGDVFGAGLAAEIDHLERGETRVRGVGPGEAGRRRRLPRDGVGRDGPQAEIKHDARKYRGNQPGDPEQNASQSAHGDPALSEDGTGVVPTGSFKILLFCGAALRSR